MYPYIKQYKTKQDDRDAFYAIHTMWLRPNDVNAMASDAKMGLQMSTNDGEKKAWNWKNYASCYIQYHFFVQNLKEHVIKDQAVKYLNVYHLSNEIRCDMMYTAVTTIKACPHRYEDELDAVVAYPPQQIKKWRPTKSVKACSEQTH